MIVATPIHFFQQELYASKFEHHVSHWTNRDFEEIGYLNFQNLDAGAVYLITGKKINIRGFGNSWIKKVRRIARAIKNEL